MGPTLENPLWNSILGIGAIVLYFLPWIVAARRKSENRSIVAILTVTLGWTGIFWFIALWLAEKGERKSADTDWRPGPVSSSPVSKPSTGADQYKEKRGKLNTFFLVLNLILLSLLISYFIRPEWLVNHRNEITKIYKRIFSRTNNSNVVSIAMALKNLSDEQLIFNQQTSLSERQLYREEAVRRHIEWSKSIAEAVLSGGVTIGMTKSQVLSSWGHPIELKVKKEFMSTREQWFYGNQSNYLYFSNGKLTTTKQSEIQEFREIQAISQMVNG